LSENKSVSGADDEAPVSAAEAKPLFASLARVPALVLAVSGGPDSTALLLLMARWRRALNVGPKLLAVTVDHGLRPASAAEARTVKTLARRLGVPHRTVRWQGKKPTTGLQQAARDARYRLLAAAAKSAQASAVVTAHTLDDQAETVLLRMSRGSGLSGLGAMARESPLPASGHKIVLVRPLLDMPKARLIATLARAKIEFAQDALNRDPRFTRARLRELMPALAREGLSARSLARLAGRLRRADAALEMAVEDAMERLFQKPLSDSGAVVLDAEKFVRLPAEVALRLLGRAIARVGAQGAIRLGKLENLYEGLANAHATRTFRLRRTLGGALVTLSPPKLVIERAPPRGSRLSAPTAHKQARRTPANRGRTAKRN
jgi:tRNA(Ile)-lysidine synthase